MTSRELKKLIKKVGIVFVMLHEMPIKVSKSEIKYQCNEYSSKEWDITINDNDLYIWS